MTTPDPGDNEVLMWGATERPRSHAFFARRPAPSMTDGLEVLVQLVMADITTEPVCVCVGVWGRGRGVHAKQL